LAFFVSQIIVFANFQNNMRGKKRVNLQEFSIIHFPKSKVGPTRLFFTDKTHRSFHRAAGLFTADAASLNHNPGPASGQQQQHTDRAHKTDSEQQVLLPDMQTARAMQTAGAAAQFARS
jgi:hypothetical protein